METIFIAADHGGFELKQHLIDVLRKKKVKVMDLGTESGEMVDFPDYAGKLAEAILGNKASRGIAICGTGLGMSMALNRHKGIRAALCTTEHLAQLAREHNDANVLCLGGRTTSEGLAERITGTWLNTKFSGVERYGRRNRKLDMC